MLNTIYYFTVIKMDTLDTEGQFYPFISTAISGNEDPKIIQCFITLSFHEDSSTPPPLSSIWDPSNIALKK